MAVPEEWEGLVSKDVRLQCNVPRISEVSGPLFMITINSKLESCKVFKINRQNVMLFFCSLH
jgi:hypothetical protein